MTTLALVRIYKSVSAKPRAGNGVQNLREWLLDEIEGELHARAVAAARRVGIPQNSPSFPVAAKRTM